MSWSPQRRYFDDRHPGVDILHGNKPLFTYQTKGSGRQVPATRVPVIDTDLNAFLNRKGIDSLEERITHSDAFSKQSSIWTRLKEQAFGVDIVFSCLADDVVVAQAKPRKSYDVLQVAHHWSSISDLRHTKARYHIIFEALDDWKEWLDNYFIDEKAFVLCAKLWTREFEKLDPEILRKDDWVSWLKNSAHAFCIDPALTTYLCDPDSHLARVQEVLQNLGRLLLKVGAFAKQLNHLCQLAFSLLSHSGRAIPTFLSQRRWFLHHSAHPPRDNSSCFLGCGGGALPNPLF
jgi:hypothetical protein